MSVFPKYECYKDSGIEWADTIPSNWDVKPGRVTLSLNKEKNAGNIEETVLSLSYGRLVIKPPEKMTGLVPESLEGYQIINPGDIIIRPTDLQNDWRSLRVGLAKDRGIITSAYLGLKHDEKVSSEYLYYLLHSYDLLKVYYGMGTGLRQNLSWDDFKYLPLTLPPNSEQDRIVAFLDQKTAEIDALIAKKQRQIELLDEQKAILINRAFSRICLKDVDVKFPTVGKLIQKQELTIQDGNHGEMHPVSADYVDDGIPFLMASDVRPEEVNLATCAKLPEKKAKKLRIGFALAGDVLLTHKATIGQVGKLPDVLDSPFVMLSPQTTYYRPLLGRIKSEYLFQLLQTNYVQEQLAVLALNQSTRGYVGLIAQKRMTLPIPSHQSQLQFESEARAIQKKTSAVRFRFKSQIEQLQSFRSLIIAHAVTGKFRCP